VIGYDFGGFRVETEVGYRKATVDGYTSTLTTPAYTVTGARSNAGAGSYSYAGGRTSALSFMLNGLLDFGDDDGIQGFVGGGVGVARVKANYQLNTRGNFVDDSDTVFAYQGLAGVRAPLTDHIDATLKYRFFNADNVKLVDVTNRTFDGRFRSHSILGGITYNFGSPTPPPPPPAAARSRARSCACSYSGSEPVVCSPGPFIVFFEWNKSDITPEAASILDNAVSAVPELRQRAGHGCGSHRHVGYAEVQRGSVAASRRLGQGVHDLACRPGGAFRPKRSAKPVCASDRRWCSRSAEPSRRNHLRPGRWSVRPVPPLGYDWGGRRKPASLFVWGR
jgi:hypothetical protein